MNNHSSNHRKEILRVILSVSLIAVAITHFTHTDQHVRIVPPFLPYPAALVQISGVIEILLAIALLIPVLSVSAAWGMIALFIAVFPANIYQAMYSIPIDGIPNDSWLYWVRLPFQAVLIAWAYCYTRRPEEQPGAGVVRERLEGGRY